MNSPQLQIDFTQPIVHHENNRESQLHFEANRDRFSAQCKIAFDAMMQGERLTTAKALIEYGIGDLRRRVKDLKDMWGVPVQSVIIHGKFKEYFININNPN
jgi:hypothetical protein